MPFTDPMMDEKNEVKSKTIKFGKVGDGFKGTLLSVKTLTVQTDKGPAQKKLYQFRAHGGAFHNVDENFVPVEPEILVEQDEICVLWGRNQRFDDDMKRAKAGSIVALSYTGNAVAKPGKRAAKIIKIYVGGIDPNYMGEEGMDVTEMAASLPEEPTF